MYCCTYSCVFFPLFFLCICFFCEILILWQKLSKRVMGLWYLMQLSTIFQLYHVLLVEETVVPGEIIDMSQVTDKLYHIMLYTSPWSRFELTTSVVMGTDCIGICKTNYHTIMAMTAPGNNWQDSQHQHELLHSRQTVVHGNCWSWLLDWHNNLIPMFLL